MIIFTSALSAQVISIADGSSIDISAEASVNIAGLELSPSANFTIVGENSISKESDVITIEGSAQVLNSPNESMSKNYMAGVSLEGYTGSVKFNYSDDEMNGVTHNASLYVMNSNSVWTEYKDEDSDDNSITYDFINPLEIKTVTAGIQTYNVTFSVNTANITVGENGMYLGGGIIGPANAYAMSDDDGDGVWTVTISMGEGTTGNYIFLNSPANGEDWGAKENLTGQECADGEYDDRLLAEVTSDTTLLHCFGSCESDGTCPATTEVTFNVDMSQYGLMDGDTVHVNGEFTGWCGSCGNEMSDDDGDGVYSITFDLEPGSYFWKYTVNGWDDQESFSDAVDGCTANNNGNFDRQVVVTDEAQELTYCWNSCDSACEDLDPAMTASVVVDGADAIFTIATENFVIGDTDADGHWHYSLNGGEDVMVYTTELTLTDLPNGDHSILIWLVDSSHNPLDPPVEQTIEFSTFNGLADCDETVVYTQVANGDYSVSLSSGDDLLASVTINATMEANWDSIIVTDGAGNQLNTQIDGEFVNADFYSTDGTISVNVLNDGSIQNGDVTLVFACVALSIDESDISGIRVYPNPSSSIVYIDSSEDLEITLYSLLGQQILKTNSKTIDISSLNDGIYLIVAKDSNNKITNFKLMKK